MIAKCGNRCDLCPAYTENIHRYDKQEISDGWFEYLGVQIDPEELECVGCLQEGRRPSRACAIRDCAERRKMVNCGHCPDCLCDLLKKNMQLVKEALEDHPDISKRDLALFIKPYENRPVLAKIKKGLKK